ncbi:putative alkaline shock family protein YloU [Clostridiales Family XIII bacterium PM5-7]
MALSKETALGKISISNTIFAGLILDSFHQEACEGKVWASTKKGKQIDIYNKGAMNEFSSTIEIDADEDGENIEIEFSIIVKFGTSIKKITDYLSDDIAAKMLQQYGKKPIQVKIRIAGVKSRQIARRNLEVIKSYEVE